ncbi:hypothetical protein D5086_026228 [Populus alba]|uniref:Uncharacterized protein n=1 Tax=Populus alba TaxID=43335 RepID=A0ACC4B1B0_POPAL
MEFLTALIMTDASERFSTREAEKFPFRGRERRDAKRRRPGDVDYDPRTLYLPAEFAKSLTGGQMGKFYELFEMDAHVGAKELDLQYMKWPKHVRSDSLGKGAFVPNDISIGGAWCASFILLTGPNMGGKSTLRQVCLAVILTQIGADVPAEKL